MRPKRFVRLLRVLANEFRTFLICLVLAFVLSTWALYSFYPRAELPLHHHSLLGTAYDTWQMIFFQSPIPFVDDWRLVPVFFGLPILGLLVIAEGVVHLGNLLFQRRRYSREWQKMMATTFENHVVVCGLGNVGFRVVQQLHRFGEEAVAIEKDAESAFIGEMEEYHVPVLIGDARDVKLLQNANIDKAKALICATDDDLGNLEVALSARELNPALRVVVRMFDQKLAKKIEKSLGFNCAFSTSALSAPVFAQAAISGDILSSFDFSGTVVNAVQLSVEEGSLLEGLSVDDVRSRFDATILTRERAGQLTWNPAPDSILGKGDKLLVLGGHENIRKLLGSP
ncbi:MAG TPA: TrkA family potassium uptake protein [Candidatus Obscuribacterales bacterium]